MMFWRGEGGREKVIPLTGKEGLPGTLVLANDEKKNPSGRGK